MNTHRLFLKDDTTGQVYTWTLQRERFMGGRTAYVCKGHDNVERVLHGTNKETALDEVREAGERHGLRLMQ